MDREKLISSLPTGEKLKGGGNTFRQQTAENFIRAILEAIGKDGREPDAWEAHDIAAAIGFMAGRMYYASIVCATRALRFPENRAPIPFGQVEPATRAAAS